MMIDMMWVCLHPVDVGDAWLELDHAVDAVSALELVQLCGRPFFDSILSCFCLIDSSWRFAGELPIVNPVDRDA